MAAGPKSMTIVADRDGYEDMREDGKHYWVKKVVNSMDPAVGKWLTKLEVEDYIQSGMRVTILADCD